AWEPMRVLSAEELRQMRLHTVDALIDQRPIPVAAAASPSALQVGTNSSPSATASIPAAEITERGWSLIDRSGASALARRHPLTIEGEDFGRFDLVFGCGESSDSYSVTYVERRRLKDGSRTIDPLREVTISAGQKSASLKIASSEPTAKPVELASLARGSLPTAAVK